MLYAIQLNKLLLVFTDCFVYLSYYAFSIAAQHRLNLTTNIFRIPHIFSLAVVQHYNRSLPAL